MRLSPSIALLRAQSDERLVKLAREGSDAAFATIVERHRCAVLAACRRILPEARAEDAAQQVYMAAWKALARGDDVRDVRAWLLKIARNTSLNALRVHGFDYEELREGLRVGPAPDEELERRDVIRHTLAGLAALPDRQREVLLRSAVEGVAHADIARDLGLTEGATRQLILRARTRLRAAASALTPWPLVVWAAEAGGGAGAGALAAKVGTAAVLAGGVAVGTPAIVQHERNAPNRAPVVPAAVVTAEGVAPTPVTRPPQPTATPTPRQRVAASGVDEDRSGRGSNRGRGGPGPSHDEPELSPTPDNSGPGSADDGGDDSSGPGSGAAPVDNSGPGSVDDSSGKGSSGSDDGA